MGSNSRETATDRTLNRPNRTCPVVPTVELAKTLIGCWLASGRLPPDASGCRFAALEPYCTRSDAAVLRPVSCHQLPVQCPVACLPSPLPSVRSLVQRPVHRPVTWFLRDLAYGLVPIFMLGLCLTLYVFFASSHVFLELLIIGSSRHLRPSYVLHPIELQSKHLQIH